MSRVGLEGNAHQLSSHLRGHLCGHREEDLLSGPVSLYVSPQGTLTQCGAQEEASLVISHAYHVPDIQGLNWVSNRSFLNPWRLSLLFSHEVMSDSFVIPWTVARQAPLSMGFARQEYWSSLPFPSPGDLPDPEIEPTSPALAERFFTTEPPEKPHEDFTSEETEAQKDEFFLQYSCLENSMNWGVWWATDHGVAKSLSQLRDWHFISLLPDWINPWNIKKAVSFALSCRIIQVVDSGSTERKAEAYDLLIF